MAVKYRKKKISETDEHPVGGFGDKRLLPVLPFKQYSADIPSWLHRLNSFSSTPLCSIWTQGVITHLTFMSVCIVLP